MKRKFFWSFLALTALVMFSAGLVACGDDDEGDGIGVVGTWEGNVDYDHLVANFKKNGTGTLKWTIDEVDEVFYETETFTYVADSETTGTMVVKEAEYDSGGGSDSGGSGDYFYTLTYVVNGNSLILKRQSGRTLATLTRK